MNILKFEITKSLKTTFIWSFAVSAFGLLYISMGPIFIEQSAPLLALLENMGDAFLQGLGIDVNVFFTPIGYFSYVGGFISIALAVQAMMYGLKAFVLEKNNKSVEFLYTKPVSRSKLFVTKNLANLILLAITQLLVISILYFATDIINDAEYDKWIMFQLLASYIPLQLMFYSVGILIGTSVKKLKNVASISIMFPIGMYVLKMISDVVGSDGLGYISFFKYFSLVDIATSGIDYKLAGIALVIIAVCSISSYIVFIRTDLSGV